MESKTEIIDEMLRLIYILAACTCIGCGPGKYIPNTAARQHIGETATHLDKADSNLDAKDYPAVKGNIGDARKSNNLAATDVIEFDKKQAEIVKWYEGKLNFYYTNPWVKAAVFIRFWFYFLLIGGGIVYALGIAAGFTGPGTLLWNLSKRIFSALPIGGPGIVARDYIANKRRANDEQP